MLFFIWTLLAAIFSGNNTLLANHPDYIYQIDAYSPWVEPVQYCLPAVVKIENHSFSRDPSTSISILKGSGVIISPGGYVVTNAHVVKDSMGLTVFYNNQPCDAFVLHADDEVDLAVLKLVGSTFSYLSLGNSSDVRMGDCVFAVSYPFASDPILSVGMVGGVSQHTLSRFSGIPMLLVDILIAPGCSGSPLLNRRHEIIGINSAILQHASSTRGLSLVLPSNTIQEKIREWGCVE